MDSLWYHAEVREDSKDTVNKGYHCVWQIHYHIVFPVKYRKTLMDEDVTRIIVETAEEIQERYAITDLRINNWTINLKNICRNPTAWVWSARRIFAVWVESGLSVVCCGFHQADDRWWTDRNYRGDGISSATICSRPG